MFNVAISLVMASAVCDSVHAIATHDTEHTVFHHIKGVFDAMFSYSGVLFTACFFWRSLEPKW